MSKQITLSGKYGKGKVALVDDADLPLLVSHSWCVLSNGYAVTRINNKFVYMHRLILGATPDQSVDHADGNPLNNIRSNLRFATSRQQMMNTRKRINARSIFKGVVFRMNRWEAQIQADGVCLKLGRYLTQREAAQAYNDAASKRFGEFARLNDLSMLPPEQDTPILARASTSAYRGVHWCKAMRKWCTKIMVNRHKYTLGYFPTELEAALAYDAYVKDHNLDRPLNFPDTTL